MSDVNLELAAIANVLERIADSLNNLVDVTEGNKDRLTHIADAIEDQTWTFKDPNKGTGILVWSGD